MPFLCLFTITLSLDTRNSASILSLMRILANSILILAALLALTTIGSYPKEYAQQKKVELIPGSDKPEIKHCRDINTAYIYDDFVVYTQPSGDYAGSNIYIYYPKAQLNDPCKLDYRRAAVSILVGEYGGANKFIGAYDNIIFLDQWTGEDFKRLLGIDVKTKSLVFLDDYADPEIRNGELIYYRTLNAARKSVRDKIPCPAAEDWAANGKQVLYVEKMTANLSTMKKVSSGEFLCIPSEPIGSVTPRSYGH